MNKNSIYIMKKIIEKVIVEELYKKDLIDFIQFNSIIKRINDDIVKIENKNLINNDMKNIIVKVSV